MKRIFVMLLCLTLLLAGCSKQPAPTEAPETTAAPTTVPPTTEAPTQPTETEPPVPETAAGTALVDKAYIVLMTANRGDTLQIVGEFDETYYVVKTETGYGLMEKQLLRQAGEAAPESWTGYAQYNAKLYTSYLLNDAEPRTLGMNTELTVLDTVGDILVVQYEEQLGYILSKDVSSSYIQPSTGGGGGGGGGTGADGGDISLGVTGGIVSLSTLAPQSGEITGEATVLVDAAEVILGWFDRDDAMEIVIEEGFAEPKEGYHTVYLDGLYGYVKQIFVLKEGDTPFESWDGYAHYNASLYDNYYLTGDAVKLNANAELKILLDLGNCYLVRVGEDTGYLAKAEVSDSYITYSSGGSGGGNSGGGEWTPPAL